MIPGSGGLPRFFRVYTVLALEWQLYKGTNTVILSEVERERNGVERLP